MSGSSLPATGVGSLAPMSRRLVTMAVDWFLATGAAALLVRVVDTTGSLQTWTLILWFLIGVATVTLFGFTPGQYFMGLRVARVDAQAPVGLARALVRQIILVFVIPALFTDDEGRGMHDRATGTGVLRTR